MYRFYHRPGIWQDDLLAGTSSRGVPAVLYSHQVADVGQHRLEVRHFPRWSLNFSTWTRLSLELFLSTTLGRLLLADVRRSHCRGDVEDAANANILIEQSVVHTEVREPDSSVGNLRAISNGETSTSSAPRCDVMWCDHPRNCSHRSRGWRDDVDFPRVHIASPFSWQRFQCRLIEGVSISMWSCTSEPMTQSRRVLLTD